jgi:hypothetical protein
MAEENKFNEIKLYLENGTSDYLYNELSKKEDSLLWIDHRDYDEDIINGIETFLETGYLKGEMIDETDDYIGFEIIIHYKGKKHKIEYKGEGSDRDTTIIALNEVLKPDYEIRLFMDSLGTDTLAFLPLSEKQWMELEKEFGQNKVDLLFMKISKGLKMFELNMKELNEILDKLKKDKNKFGIIDK